MTNRDGYLSKDISTLVRAWVGYLKQQVPITSKSPNFEGEIQHYVVKLPKSAGTRQYCSKIPRVPGTLGTRANSSPATYSSSISGNAATCNFMECYVHFCRGPWLFNLTFFSLIPGAQCLCLQSGAIYRSWLSGQISWFVDFEREWTVLQSIFTSYFHVSDAIW